MRLRRVHRGGRDARALAAVAGSDPRIRHASYGTATVGMCTSIPPLAWGRSRSSNPVREGQTASRDGLVPVLRADAEQPHSQSVGERVVRRLEAALEPPSRAGIAGLGATRGGGAGGAQTRPAPNPQQSLGLPGRSQPGLRVPCGPDRPGQRGARPLRSAASAVVPVRTSRATGCASAPHVVFAGAYGPDPRYCRCANHSVEDSQESTDKAASRLVVSARETRPRARVKMLSWRQDSAIHSARRLVPLEGVQRLLAPLQGRDLRLELLLGRLHARNGEDGSSGRSSLQTRGYRPAFDSVDKRWEPPIRQASYGTAMVGMCTSIPTSLGVAVQQSRAGGPRRASDGRVPALRGDAGALDSLPVGDRVIRRLEAALDRPSGPYGPGRLGPQGTRRCALRLTPPRRCARRELRGRLGTPCRFRGPLRLYVVRRDATWP